MIDTYKTCRCCLQVSKEENDLHEFSSEVAMDPESSDFVKINECYTELTAISIPNEEEDSTKICSSCLGDLKFSFLFKKKCLNSAKVYDQQEVQFCVVEEISIPKDENQDIEDQCYVEYVEEEMICENTEDPVIMDDELDNESDAKEDEIEFVPNKRQNPSNIEQEDGVTYNCDLCSKIFDRKEYYKRHFKRAHLSSAIEEKSDQLTEEGKSSEISQLQIFQCDCGKINISREDHELHQAEHEGEARFKCKKCEEYFNTKDEARKHLTVAHTSEEKPFACENCSKCFKNRYQLILHTRSHTGEKPFSCPICNRAFSMSSNLQKHLDTHSTEKPYQCTYCDQFFKTQRSLKFHTVCYHQPEAKVKCPECDKSFVNKSYLKMHMLYHTGQKNFTCIICNSKYYKSSHLKRHIQNVHFKLRLMKCEYCASDFVRKETYKSHIISHHKRHLSDQEFEEVLEKIRKFKPPVLNIDEFTVEKQKNNQQVIITKIDDNEMDLEMIEEQIEDGMEKSNEGMIIETEDDYTYFEEEEDGDDE